jgi:Protein of unknown function (DUF1203)
MQSFRIRGLPAHEFEEFFTLNDADLERRCARRLIANGSGYPCRISLTDAMEGDEVILVNYEHHRVASPFRSSFAIYVRQGEHTFDAVDQVPEQLRTRMLALRGYAADGMLVTAELVAGSKLEAGIDTVFAAPEVAYIHAHFAKPGCYAALIERH